MSTIWLILKRCALRHWRLAWRQQLALLLILALGSGVYLAMRLANRAALSGFEQFTNGITRQPDWTVSSPTGVLREVDLTAMREALGNRPVHLVPMVEETVTPVPEGPASVGSLPTWRLVGLDWVGLLNLRGDAPLRVLDARTPADGVLLSAKLATKLKLLPGSELPVVVDERVVRLKVAGTIPVMPDMPTPPEHLMLMDLPAAQKAMGRKGEVDRVEVVVQKGAAFPTLREENGAILRQHWQVSGPDDRRVLAGTMTEGFRLNLTILSLLALFVGGYLIFQALDGVVLRRREEIGILKSLGVRDREIQIAFLLEAVLLGLIGGGLGLLLGWAGAQSAVSGVTRTVNALYGATNEHHARLHAGEAALSLGIALVTSMVAAWWPARAAAATPPSQMLGRKSTSHGGGRWWRAEWLGWALMLTAVVVAQFGPVRLAGGARIPLAGYAAAILWLLGTGLAAGSLLRLVRPIRTEEPTQRLAASHLRRPTVRHRFAVAALASAVAMTAGMAIMVASFDSTVRAWISRTMKADIYLASAGAQSASSTNHIRAETVQSIARLPEVAELAALQAQTILLRGAPTMVMGVDAPYTRRHDLYSWVQEPREEAWWQADASVPAPAIMNESFAERFHVKVGDVLELPGGHPVLLKGIYADYGNERGSVSVPQETFRAWYRTEQAWRVALMLKPGTDAQAFADRLRKEHPGLSPFTNAHLRGEALRVFRQTFAVTYALEVIGVFVAVAGLGLALACLLLERRADLATMRALGMTTGQVARTSAWEGACVACAGTLMGLASGGWLGWLLIYRVNKQCFGWTLGFSLPWMQLTGLALAVLTVGTLVAAMVGRWSARIRWEEEA